MKLLIAFMTAHHKSRESHVLEQRKNVLQFRKWGVRDFHHVFVYGNPESQEPGNRAMLEHTQDGLYLDCDDRKEYMVLKCQGLFKYALENGYDYVFRACDDTILYPHRLISHKILFEHDYFGTMCGYGNIHGMPGAFVLRFLDYMHGGVGIGLSRKSMEILVADKWEGPDSSPLSQNIEIVPGHIIQGGWHVYWDDLWIGEVLRGKMKYDDPRRNDTYYNYLVHVYDDPQRFASNFPFDKRIVIAHHGLDQMGKSDLQPGPFSTKTSRALNVSIPWDQVDSKFKINNPDEEARRAHESKSL